MFYDRICKRQEQFNIHRSCSTRFGINDIMLFMTESVDVPRPIRKWIKANITLPMKAFKDTIGPNGQHLTVPEQLSRTREQFFLSARGLLDDGCGASEIIELFQRARSKTEQVSEK